MIEMTSNGRYVEGDEIEIKGTVRRITANGQGIRVELPIDGQAGSGARVASTDVHLPQRLRATVTNRVHKSPGQLYWESVRDEAIARTDGTAHPTQPWENLLPSTKAKMEERAARFIDSVVNAG